MQKTCKATGTTFEISDTELKFLERVAPVIGGRKHSIPPPTLSPEARWLRRLAFRNERTLYKRKCNLSGREMVAMHPADAPFPVYHITEWVSDKWDPMDYGKDFDFSRPFFEQFKEFCDAIPHFSAFVDPHMDINSEYTNCSSEAKNCYLITQAEKNEDCYYSRGINQCKNCCDCLRVQKCELCYEVIYGTNCHHCLFCQDVYNCSDCHFSSDLRSCRNCFGCHGLSQKEYHIFNEPVSKEEWTEKVGSLVLTHAVIGQMKKQSDETRLKTPQRAVHTIQCEDCIGDHIVGCRGSRNVFDSADLEHCTYVYEVANGAKDCMDYSMWGINCELLYECNGCGYNVQRCLFCNHCWQGVTDLLYCESCFPSVKNCFGCFGLRRAGYCILNKKYGKEEYEKITAKIIEHMQKTGEWGEFFPVGCSPHAYNESLANEFFPMTKEEVETRGWRWRDDEDDTGVVPASDIRVPESIADTGESICGAILTCEVTGKLYKVIPHELRLLKKLGLPVPRKSPQQRHKERMQNRNPRKLWSRQCVKCGREIQTTFAPGCPETVYCEECYLKEIY